jgi:nonsense-mediated mRNA decay protein 3
LIDQVKLVDAGFIWTEPHSKRLKVKLTIQKEVFHGTILQQTFQADYVIQNNLCQV